MDWTQISAALVLLIGAITAFVNSRINSHKQAVTAEAKLDDIHVLVNSRLTSVLGDLKILRDYIDANRKPGDPPVPETSGK